MADFPRVTFGIIVFNGEPFIRYNLRALYPFAHEIIVVEGACEASSSFATKDGHSMDGTLETLHRFQAEEDKEKKVQIVVRDGFWEEKDQQSRAYAERATGDYIWQIDIDEFYEPEGMSKIFEMIRKDPSISGCSIKQITFWGGFDYLTDGFYLRSGADKYRRLFRWGPGYSFITHRPPTIYDEQKRDLTTLNWLEAEKLLENGIILYHYSLLFPKQVIEKSEYYSQAQWAERPLADKWAQDVYMNLRNPYRVHNVYEYVSWLERFQGKHPPQIQALMKDIQAGTHEIRLRKTDDIDKLLRSPFYKIGRSFLKQCEQLQRKYQTPWNRNMYRLKHPIASFRSLVRKIVHSFNV
jgi:hypothetical protein